MTASSGNEPPKPEDPKPEGEDAAPDVKVIDVEAEPVSGDAAPEEASEEDASSEDARTEGSASGEDGETNGPSADAAGGETGAPAHPNGGASAGRILLGVFAIAVLVAGAFYVSIDRQGNAPDTEETANLNEVAPPQAPDAQDAPDAASVAASDAASDAARVSDERLAALEDDLAAAKAQAEQALSAAQSTPDTDALIARIAALESRLAALGDAESAFSGKIENLRSDVLEEAKQARGAQEADRAALEQRVTEAERSRAELQSEMVRRDQAAQDRIAALQARVDKLQNSSASKAKAIAAVLTLQNKINTGAPFTDELAAVSRVAPDTPSLTALRAYAAKGVPGANALQSSFDVAARAAQQADARANAKGPAAKLWANLTSLVTVRSAEPVAGEATAAVLSRADAAVGRGDIAGAVNELDALAGAPAEAMAGWIEQAKARVAADGLLEDLNEQVTEGM